MKSFLLSLIVVTLLFVACNDGSSGLGIVGDNNWSNEPITESTEAMGFAEGEISMNANGGTTSYDYKFDKKADDGTYQGNDAIEQKLIKNGFVSLESDSAALTHAKLMGLVSKYDGVYISKDEQEAADYYIRHNVTLKIKPKDFDNFVKDVTIIGAKVLKQEVSVTDVSEEFIDLTARIKTKKVLEQRYINLLSKATKVEDMLNIERQIESVRSEIERKEGRLRYLAAKVSFGTLRVNIYQELEPTDGPTEDSYFTRLANSFLSGVRGFGNFFLGIVRIWPLLLILGIISLVVYRKLKKRKTTT